MNAVTLLSEPTVSHSSCAVGSLNGVYSPSRRGEIRKLVLLAELSRIITPERRAA